MTRITNPVPVFFDGRNLMIDGGKIYIGTANLDPQDNPIQCWYDLAYSIPATQPLRTQGGVIVNEGTGNPAFVYVDADDYSLRVRDADDNEVNTAYTTRLTAAQAYQPLDSDLTAIAALTTTGYGRALLTLANQGALKAATGIPDPLPTTGGTVTGPIVRGGAGAHFYWTDAGMTNGGVSFTEEGAADPTTLAGQIWLELEPL